MAKKQFKAESKRLLDLMINSIYTNKEIFLRELISNANDAIDKSYYLSLVDEKISFNKEDFYIRITPDKENRTLTITDTGIGMSKEELESNLGTIARSGSLKFKNANEVKDGVDIIGQFGVGFYSSFMVADTVTVKSRALNSEEAFAWQSKGADGYTVEPIEKDTVGTEIILNIKDNTEDELETMNESFPKCPAYPERILVFGHMPTWNLYSYDKNFKKQNASIWYDMVNQDKIGIDCGVGFGGRMAALELPSYQEFYV
jgi:HSP90 family molecular chaperone